MDKKYNEKLTELSFGEETSKFPKDTDVELDENILTNIDSQEGQGETQEGSEDDGNIQTQEETTATETQETEGSENTESTTNTEVNETNVSTEQIEVADENLEEDGQDAFFIFASEVRDDFFPDVDDDSLKKMGGLDDLKGALRNSLLQNFQDWKSQYTSSLVDNLKKDGYITKGIEDSPLMYTEEDIKDNEDKAKSVLRAYYKEKDLSDNIIESVINNSVDIEKDASTALTELKGLVSKKEAAKKAAEEQQNLQTEKDLVKNIDTFKDFVPGFKLDESQRGEILNEIPEVMAKINSNLLEYMPKLAILAKAGILDGDFKNIVLKGESDSNDKFRNALLRSKNKSTAFVPDGNKEVGGGLNIDNSDIKRFYKK